VRLQPRRAHPALADPGRLPPRRGGRAGAGRRRSGVIWAVRVSTRGGIQVQGNLISSSGGSLPESGHGPGARGVGGGKHAPRRRTPTAGLARTPARCGSGCKPATVIRGPAYPPRSFGFPQLVGSPVHTPPLPLRDAPRWRPSRRRSRVSDPKPGLDLLGRPAGTNAIRHVIKRDPCSSDRQSTFRPR
jgi:hypothetical protein